MSDIQLNEDQASAILTEGMSRGLYESLNNTLPPDPAQRLKDATDLVSIAINASKNGNKSDNVNTILFLAQVDQQPKVTEAGEKLDAVKNEIPAQVLLGQVNKAPPIKEAEETNAIQGFDITQVSDGVLEGLIIGLDKFPNNENVENERKAYLAEKERRSNEKGSKIQDEPQSTTAQAPDEKAGEAAPEGALASVEVGSQLSGEAGDQERAGGEGTADRVGSVEQQDSAQGEDAGAFARAQTPETSPEGKQAKAKPVEEDGDRVALEEELTLPIIKAHEVDITKLESIPIAQIKFMIENPEGAPEKEDNKQMSINESQVESSAIPNNEVKAVGGISPEVSAPVKVVSKADLGLGEVEEDSIGGISAEREKLESLVTGPMIKAYGRSRKEIPSIGDNELRFMILNPDGKVQPEELERAKALDGNIPENTPQSEIDNTVTVAESYDNPNSELEQKVENAADFPIEGQGEKVKEEKIKDRTIAEASKESVDKVSDATVETVIKSPPVEEVQQRAIDKHNVEYDKSHSSLQKEDQEQQQNRAMEIISREGMPIPPAYSDEQAPILPMDVSQCSRDELFSYHARFHAYESRMLWIMSQEEDVFGDIEKLRKNREAVVAAEVPFMGEDGKRNTNEYRDSQVAADKEVLDLGMQEHEIKKVVKRLKVLCDSYHRSCERLSRQMSKYERERLDAPR